MCAVKKEAVRERGGDEGVGGEPGLARLAPAASRRESSTHKG